MSICFLWRGGGMNAHLTFAIFIVSAWFATSIGLGALWAIVAIRTQQARENIAADASDGAGAGISNHLGEQQ